MNNELTRYNIRSYGLWINDRQEVLVSDEFRLNTRMTKFPGGGHQLGEGLGDGLKREWMEELGLEINVGKVFYINDFLQVSAFNRKEQLLSVYFLVTPLSFPETAFPYSTNSLVKEVEGMEVFRWAPIAGIGADHFTFPIDKVVLGLLQEAYG